MEESLYQQVYRLPLEKEIFNLITEMVVNYNDNDGDKWFLSFDEKGNDVYMKHCKVLIEPIAESKDKKKGTKDR